MKIFFDSIGCRLNQSEIEKMAAQARKNGHEVVGRSSEADIVIINTCAVTSAASADSRKKIRQAARSGNARIIATGCYTTIAPDEVAELPEVHRQVPNSGKDQLIQNIAGESSGKNDAAINARIALPGRQHRTRAFIKVQDGCDNLCTFCITRVARGKCKSQMKEEIFRDVEAALEGGAKEIVLTGVNLGAWGADLDGNLALPDLIKEIVVNFSPPRLRLSSLEPWDIDDSFFETLKLPGFCRHLHLPLQSGSAGVLHRMGRRNTSAGYRNLLKKIRQVVPEIAITTDIMVGFPGESEQEFLQGLDFVREMNFAGGHVFNFSVRPGTAAERMRDYVPAQVRKERSAVMRQVIAESQRNYMDTFMGNSEDVLWERSKREGEKWVLQGLTDTYLRVMAVAEMDLWNTISSVKLQKSEQQPILGRIVD